MLAFDRDTVLAAVVGTGGAWLLGAALLNVRAGGARFSAVQRKALVFAGGGFLMSAAAARWLSHTGARGAAVATVGTLFAMRGMYLLLRERVAERDAARAADRARDTGGTPGPQG